MYLIFIVKIQSTQKLALLLSLLEKWSRMAARWKLSAYVLLSTYTIQKPAPFIVKVDKTYLLSCKEMDRRCRSYSANLFRKFSPRASALSIFVIRYWNHRSEGTYELAYYWKHYWFLLLLLLYLIFLLMTFALKLNISNYFYLLIIWKYIMI
jgi:hypothetical protein